MDVRRILTKLTEMTERMAVEADRLGVATTYLWFALEKPNAPLDSLNLAFKVPIEVLELALHDLAI